MDRIQMKKYLSLIIITLVILIANGTNTSVEAAYPVSYDHPIYDNDYRRINGIPYPEQHTATCNKKTTTCYIGYYTMHTSNSKKPLFITENGSVVCNNARTRCTDGNSMVKRGKPMY